MAPSELSDSAAPSLDPSVPSPDDTCHLLRIPRELRDQIYEYTLSEPEGLFYCSRSNDVIFPLYVSADAAFSFKSLEVNQLKYACHQLYAETFGLGLKYNKITFTSSSLPCAAEQFLEFFHKCSPKNQDRLLDINLRTSHPLFDDYTSGQAQHVYQIIDFCRTHPKKTINIILSRDYGCDAAYHLIRKVAQLKSSVRGRSIFEKLPPSQHKQKLELNFRYAGRWGDPERTLQRNDIRLKELNLPNLRFRPNETVSYEECLRTSPTMCKYLDGADEEVMNEIQKVLVSEIRDWRANGF